tara:strand:- start:200 stop:736 length:537 start_codon:yes stop_codon:yes gene_type:complete
MRYFSEMQKAMNYLGKLKKTIFLGQAVKFPGTVMSKTFENIPEKKLLELPVAEEMQMGITLGLAMNGYIPVSVYPRWNFLLLSINQLINHIDKFSEMTDGEYRTNIIIRTSIGSIRPLNPQSQHIGDFSESIKQMSKNLDIIKLKNPNDIMKSYKHAANRKDSKTTILVEYGDYYNEK